MLSLVISESGLLFLFELKIPVKNSGSVHFRDTSSMQTLPLNAYANRDKCFVSIISAT